MKIAVKKLVTNLTFWVLIAISIGIVMGLTAPEEAVKMEFLGKGFISVVKLFINPIIFLTIALGIAAMGDLKKVGRTGGKAILYFEIVTSLALIIGIAVAHVLQPGKGVDTSKANQADVSLYVQKAQAFSWLQFFKDNLTLQVLVVAIITGILLSLYDKTHRVIKPLTAVSKYVFIGLHIVMYAAPIGAFGGIGFYCGQVRALGAAVAGQADGLGLSHDDHLYFRCARTCSMDVQNTHTGLSEIYTQRAFDCAGNIFQRSRSAIAYGKASRLWAAPNPW